MSGEIKLVYEAVKSQTEKMNTAADGLEPKAEATIEGNVMDTVDKLTELTADLEACLSKYKAVLKKNIASAEKSIEHLRQTDENISQGISSVRGGPQQLQ